MKTRQYTIIILFILITVGLSIYSLTGNFDDLDVNEAPKGAKNDSNDESFFKVVDYYLVDKSKPFLQLESSELTISQENSVVVATNPVGVIYRHNEKGEEEDPINFKAKHSQATLKASKLYLKDEVEVDMANTNMKSNDMTIFDNGRHLQAVGNVRTNSFDPNTNDQILINSLSAIYRPHEQFFEYQKSVKGEIHRKRKYEENVSFTTDLLTLEGAKSEVEMKGNVTFKKGNLDASSNQGTVFLENYNKKLKYYSLSDDVRLQETLVVGPKTVIRKAFSEKLEGLISEKKVILTGLPKVFQEKDVIKGNRITIHENVETVEVDDANTNITLEGDKKNKQSKE
ncbi:MAG: LPS export ABC transporter periplasmic protein LptC [Rhizobacter sp.]|nr:LPS export ABC transporter periplasmic protein LptC [Bacteriovorax sp.]